MSAHQRKTAAIPSLPSTTRGLSATRVLRQPVEPVAQPPDRFVPLLGATLIAVVALAQVWLLRDLRTLPSPIFGGDYSYQMGCIESIRASGNPMASCSVSGALPGYLPLYGTLVAVISRIGGWAVVPSMIGFSVFLRALATGIAWWVFTRLYGRGAGFTLACLSALLNPEPIFKYTEFTFAVIVPLYFHALFRFVEKPALPAGLYLGLTLAAAGYSHAVVFIGGIVVAVLSSAIGLLAGAPEGRAPRARAAVLGLAVAAACSALALGYWYRPIFVHHGASSLHYTEWNGGVSLVTAGDQLRYARAALLAMVRLDQWPYVVQNGLCLLGLVLVWRSRERRRWLPGIWIAAATLLWIFHYVVTMPLLHTHLVPDYVRRYLWFFAAWLPAAIPVVTLHERIRSRAAAIALPALVFCGSVAGLVAGTLELARDPAMANARNTLDPALASLQSWAFAHTKPDDVVLSSNELSFAWAALTGRKTVVARRAQNDPFVDMDVRNRDAALMLYGSDEEARSRLLRQYGVRYLLWTPQWIPSEYYKDPKLGFAYMDPLLYFRNDAYDRALERAGVQIINFYGWVDPALRGPEYPRFELTLVSPDNYRSLERPWREALDAHIEKVWSYEEQGRETAVLYAVKP
jgi:hypothetical protein